jgi:hypothetical protein
MRMTDNKHLASGAPVAPAQELRSEEAAPDPAKVGVRLVSGFSEFFSSRRQSRRGLYLGLVRVEGSKP